MNRDDSISSELGPYVEPDEAAGLDDVADRLLSSRPLPRPGLRAAIRAGYAMESGEPGRRPAHLWRQISAYAGAGLVLLVIAAIGLTGVGPLGY